MHKEWLSNIKLIKYNNIYRKRSNLCEKTPNSGPSTHVQVVTLKKAIENRRGETIHCIIN